MKLRFGTAISLALCVFAEDRTLKVSELPAPVQKTVQEQTKGAALKGISKEVEGGKVLYEIETSRDGKGRDFILDATGAVVEVEEETPLSALPPAAQASILKKAAGGRLTRVEALTKGGNTTYEAAITKGGKKLEFAVYANGSDVK